MLRAALVALCLGSAAMAEQKITHLSFSDLEGWEDDSHQPALEAFLETCGDLKDPDWIALCAQARKAGDAKAFFEVFFQPVLIEDGEPMLFTGYFEPELSGSPVRTLRYRYPLYSMPQAARDTRPWLTRREIEEGNELEGHEIVWVDDPVELFFLQIQGSGRVRFEDGGGQRVGYGGSNGRPYTSVGARLIERGVFESHQVSARVIQNWVKANPVRGIDLLRENESYVFFRKVDVPEDKGPLGAMNRSITTMRTVAVDPEFTPLGAPVWIEKGGVEPLNRLMIAQDTGSAIKGAQRADVFYGTGDAAGRAAGQVRDRGRMVVLLPIQRAYAMLPDRVQ